MRLDYIEKMRLLLQFLDVDIEIDVIKKTTPTLTIRIWISERLHLPQKTPAIHSSTHASKERVLQYKPSEHH